MKEYLKFWDTASGLIGGLIFGILVILIFVVSLIFVCWISNVKLW